MTSPRNKRRPARLMLFLVGVVGILIAIDHWQGGPLGREFTVPWGSSANQSGITTDVGKRIWFGGDVLLNSTWFPFRILSVQPINTPAGLSAKAGIMVNPSSAGGIAIVNANDMDKYAGASGSVNIPAGTKLDSRNRYLTSLVVVVSRPGSYHVDGLLVTYRWGPFIYRAKVSSMAFNVVAKGGS